MDYNISLNVRNIEDYDYDPQKDSSKYKWEAKVHLQVPGAPHKSEKRVVVMNDVQSLIDEIKSWKSKLDKIENS